MNKRDFILSNFVIDDFIEKVNGNVILEETESSGKSKLTMPVERRVRTGGIPPKKEWDSGKVQLNFGEILRVDHEKIQMSRQGNELVGTACLGKGNCRVRN